MTLSRGFDDVTHKVKKSFRLHIKISMYLYTKTKAYILPRYHFICHIKMTSYSYHDMCPINRPHIFNKLLYNGRTRERLIRFHRSSSRTSYHKFRIPSCTHRRLSVMSELCFCSCQRLCYIVFIIPILPAFVNRAFADLTIC